MNVPLRNPQSTLSIASFLICLKTPQRGDNKRSEECKGQALALYAKPIPTFDEEDILSRIGESAAEPVQGAKFHVCRGQRLQRCLA